MCLALLAFLEVITSDNQGMDSRSVKVDAKVDRATDKTMIARIQKRELDRQTQNELNRLQLQALLRNWKILEADELLTEERLQQITELSLDGDDISDRQL